MPRERQVGETAKFLWPEDGKYYPVEITDKHDDGTYDVYLLEDDVVVDNVDPKDFEPFKGTGDFEPFKGTYLSYYFVHSPSSLSQPLYEGIKQCINQFVTLSNGDSLNP